MVLTFATGRKLVYKPKDLGTEEAYIELLAWLNERGAPLPFKLLKIMNCSSHGWVEFVEHIPCRNAEEVRRFYRRAGMLLCLGYALEGADWHFENLIASGEHPVVVDMEALLHHRARPFNEEDGADARMLAVEQLGNSVLRLGLLPEWRVSKDGQIAYDLSGLGGVEVQDVPYKIAKWESINTDRMTLEFMTGQFQGQANVPMAPEAPINLADHADEIIAGFEQMYQFLIDQRDALLASDSPLQELGRQEVRFIFRATRTYGLILKQLLNPKYLRDGADQSIQIELLARALLPPSAEAETSGEPSLLWPVFAAERQAMEQTDIPFFTARPDSDSLVVRGKVIEACFVEPSFELAVRRLRSFGPEDLEHQVGIIRAVLYSRIARDTDIASVASMLATASEVSANEPLTSEALVLEAIAIAEQIRIRAIAAEDGSATWIAPVYMVQAERYQLKLAGYDLYNGVTGIALFLAAVDKITASSAHRDLALGAVQPLRLGLQRHGERVATQLGIGGASGLGSVVYALVGLSRFLDEPVLLQDARRAALLIKPERISDDVALDIISGAAGATLGLLALHRAVPDQDILDRAIACGEHLLKARTTTEAGHRAWPTIHGKYLTGFSHGAAGIAYALLRLYEATQNAAFLDAAREGISYEDSLFFHDAGNWPDLRHEEQPAFMTAWCHGAPGVGLARLGGLSVLDTAEMRADIEAALQTTQQQGTHGLDLLCCGSLGRLEFLLAAAERLPRPALAETARHHVSDVLSKTRQRGSFYIHPLLPDGVYSPGFFRGTAGIGYELLRLAHPEQLPSVLLWE
jgi:type 2 lantibiotic biosynthesis protein LanM